MSEKPAPQKPYPLVRCSVEEAQVNRQFGLMRSALDQTLDIALQRHAAEVYGLINRTEATWDALKKKYGLEPAKNYGIRVIDGLPYICELKID